MTKKVLLSLSLGIGIGLALGQAKLMTFELIPVGPLFPLGLLLNQSGKP